MQMGREHPGHGEEQPQPEKVQRKDSASPSDIKWLEIIFRFALVQQNPTNEKPGQHKKKINSAPREGKNGPDKAGGATGGHRQGVVNVVTE